MLAVTQGSYCLCYIKARNAGITSGPRAYMLVLYDDPNIVLLLLYYSIALCEVFRTYMQLRHTNTNFD